MGASGGCLRVDGCRAVQILCLCIPPIGIVMTTKPGDPRQGQCNGGYRRAF